MIIPGFWPLATSRMGHLVSSLVWLQMWVTDESMCSEAILGYPGQLDTRGLSQGILDLEEPKMWCHWSLHMQLLCCVLTVLIILTVHLLVVMTIAWFLLLMCRLMLKPIQFWDTYIHICIVCYGDWPGSLVARECFMYYNDPIGSKWEL